MKFLFLVLILSLSGIYRLSSSISKQPDELAKSIERGKEVYNANCAACHQVNGEGLSGVYPPLAGSDHLPKDQEKSIRILLKGQNEELKVNGVDYNMPMPSLDNLSDQEIADVLNYTGNSWGNQLSTVTPDQVRSKRD